MTLHLHQTKTEHAAAGVTFKAPALSRLYPISACRDRGAGVSLQRPGLHGPKILPTVRLRSLIGNMTHGGQSTY